MVAAFESNSPTASDVTASRYDQHMQIRGKRIGAFLLSVTILFTGAVAQESAPSESQVKAAFLVTFPKYVDWPTDRFSAADSPIVIGTLGGAGIEQELERMIVDRSVDGRPLVFRKITSEKDLVGCHVLFLGMSERNRIADLLDALTSASVLTVSDVDDFLELGGVIKFTRRDRNVRIEVNLTVAQRAGLRISAKLLAVADQVIRQSR